MTYTTWHAHVPIVMPRIVRFTGITHVMGGYEGKSRWQPLCNPSVYYEPWETRPGKDVDCMACIVEPNSVVRRLGGTLRITERKGPVGITHEAWVTGDLEAETTCGMRLYLPMDEQTERVAFRRIHMNACGYLVADGALPDSCAQAFHEHLVECQACWGGLVDALQIGAP